MKVILEHNEILDAIAEYAARKLNVKSDNINVKLNARKGRKFDANIEIIEQAIVDGSNEIKLENINDIPLTDNTTKKDRY